MDQSPLKVFVESSGANGNGTEKHGKSRGGQLPKIAFINEQENSYLLSTPDNNFLSKICIVFIF